MQGEIKLIMHGWIKVYVCTRWDKYISSVIDIVPKTTMQGEIELVMHRGITISDAQGEIEIYDNFYYCPKNCNVRWYRISGARRDKISM